MMPVAAATTHGERDGSKVRLALFFYVLMEFGPKYSILEEKNFLVDHPPFKMCKS